MLQCYLHDFKVAPNPDGVERCQRVLKFLQIASGNDEIVRPSIADLHTGRAFNVTDAERAFVSDTDKKFYYSQMRFMSALASISERLLALAGRERQPSLSAEISLLNANFPAHVCIPFLCNGLDDKCSHRIMRVVATDAVVLDSAERVPYLVHIEVIQDTEENPFKLPEKVTPGDLGMHYYHTPLQREQPEIELYSEKEFSERMRTAAIMLSQLAKDTESEAPGKFTLFRKRRMKGSDDIRAKIISEMKVFEEKRYNSTANALHEKMGGVSPSVPHEASDIARTSSLTSLCNHKDLQMEPSGPGYFNLEDWGTRFERLRSVSPYGQNPHWQLHSIIVKSHADLRQEQFAIQLVKIAKECWGSAGIACWVFPYHVMVTGPECGIIETVKNTVSIHSLLKNDARNDGPQTFRQKFGKLFGEEGSDSYVRAQLNFAQSLAGYSIVTYLFNIKDRHNGNILLDYTTGHIIHIDFGFILSNSPGSVGFETAPFKFPSDYLDIMGGINSHVFDLFRSLLVSGFQALRKEQEKFLFLVEIMEKSSPLACFRYSSATESSRNVNFPVTNALLDRMLLGMSDEEVEEFVDKLIAGSLGNIFTRLYDSYQYYTQGIMF